MPFFAGCNISNDFIRCVIVSHTGEIAAEKYTALSDSEDKSAADFASDISNRVMILIDLCVDEFCSGGNDRHDILSVEFSNDTDYYFLCNDENTITDRCTINYITQEKSPYNKGKIIFVNDLATFRLTKSKPYSSSANCSLFGYNPQKKTFENNNTTAENFFEIKNPGEIIGEVDEKGESYTGFGIGTKICCGTVGDNAMAVSAGAVKNGEWASIIGSVLKIRGACGSVMEDGDNLTQSFYHPDGLYFVGGTSRAGGACLAEKFGIENLKKFDSNVLGLIPTKILIYPLVGKGETFPFKSEIAKEFIMGYGNERELYTAYLEGVSYLEKLSFEKLEKMGYEISGDGIFAVGGSTKGLEWLKIRATVLGKKLHVPKYPYSAFGAAVMASAGVYYDSLAQATENMVKIERTVTPYIDFQREYNRLYLEFKDKCRYAYEKEFKL